MNAWTEPFFIYNNMCVHEYHVKMRLLETLLKKTCVFLTNMNYECLQGPHEINDFSTCFVLAQLIYYEIYFECEVKNHYLTTLLALLGSRLEAMSSSVSEISCKPLLNKI